MLGTALATTVSHDSMGSGAGSVGFTFSAADKNFDFLAQGETLTVVYDVTVKDSQNVTSTQPITVTITGTEDAPVLAADVSGPHTTTEIVDDKNDSTLDQTAPGTLTFTDVDLTDTHTVSNSLFSATWSSGGTLPSGLSTVLGTALATTVSHDSMGSGAGSVGFTFSAADKNFDFLAQGETLTVVYDVTIKDSQNVTSTQQVTVVIHTGTEDAPVLAVDASGPHTITERLADKNDSTLDQTAPGTLTFTDVDLDDTHTVSNSLFSATWSGGSTLPSGLSTVLGTALATTVSHDSMGSGAGSVGFTFSAADKNFDFLAQGETLTVVYDVTVKDSQNVTSTQPITVTITGSEDAPVLAVDASGPHTITERLADKNDSTLDQTAPGTLTFTDVDLDDTHTVSNSLFSATWSGGSTLPSGLSTVLGTALATTVSHDSMGSGAGSVGFTFSAADKNFDFLAQGETLTVVYNVTVKDSQNVTSTQPITVTITGSEDAPVLAVDASGPHTITERLADKNDSTLDQTAPGTLTFTDVDLDDTHTVSNSLFSATWSGGSTLPSGLSTVLGTALATTVSHDSMGSGAGSVGFTFSAADKNFDFLAQGETLTVVYDVTVKDSQNVTSTQPITVTITGSEDKPVIVPAVQSGLVTEDLDGAAGENTETHHQSGTINFTDVDLSDIETQSITNTLVTPTLAHGYVLTTAQQNALVSAFTLDAATHSTTNGTGTIGWHYDLADSAIDFLGANDQVVLTYTVQVNDGNGGTDTQNVTITVHGTEDKPVIVPAVQSGLVTEDLDGAAGENTETHHQSGTINFTDVDLSDIETQSITNTLVTPTLAHGYVLTAAQQNALVSAFTLDAATHSTTNGTGTIGWHYDLADSAIDFLGANDQVVLTYTVQVNDGNGGTDTQNVTITVHGSEDKPVIVPAVQSGLVTEDLDGAAGENTETHHQSGTINFTDVDLSDIETQSITNTLVTPTLAHGYVLTTAQQNALVSAFTLDAATHSTTNGTGTIGWHYDLADSAIDFLGANDQVVLTYTVQVNDGNGGTDTQNVTITVHGTEDKPVIVPAVQSGLVTEDLDGAAGENTETHHQSGTINFTDVDLSDIETQSITNTLVTPTLAHGYVLTAAQQNALVSAFGVDPATHSTTNGTGTIGWQYELADSAIDFLGANDQVVLTYTVQVNDGNGGTDTQNVTITVHGTEDKPVLAADASGPHTITELSGGEDTTDQASGTLFFTDVDLSDTHTASKGTPTFAWSGHSLSGSQISALIAASTLTLSEADSTGNGTGSIAFTYSAPDGAFEFLNQGETLTITYNVTVTDSNNVNSTQPITITIIGTTHEVETPTLDATLATTGQTNDFVVAAKNTSVSLILAAADPDGDGVITVTISGLPSDVTLTNSANNTLTIVGGSITLTHSQLAGLTLHTSQTEIITLNITATNTENGSSATSAPQTLVVDVSSHITEWKGSSNSLTENWSTGSAWQASGPNGPTNANDALIDPGGSSPYTITINSAAFADSLVINDPNATVIDAANGSLTLGGALTPGGVLAIDAGTFRLAGGTLSVASIFIAANATLLTQGSYTLNETILNNGIIEASSGALQITHDLIGIGTLKIDSGATLELGGFSAENINFVNNVAGSYGTLILDHSIGFAGQISGFTGTDSAHSDAIDLKDIQFSASTTLSYHDNSGNNTGGTLSILNSGNVVDTITFATGNFTSLSFKLGSDGHTGTLITDPTILTEASSNPVPLTQNADTVSFIDGTNKVIATDATITNGDVLTGGTGADTLSVNTAAGVSHIYAFGDGADGHSDIGLTKFENLTLTDQNADANNHDTITVTFNADFQNDETLTVDGSALHDLSGTKLTVDAHLSAHDSFILIGSNGNDTLVGGSHNDTIIGSGGGDTLSGGGGNDTFVFRALTDSQPGAGHFDTITDFTHNSDHIDLSAIAGATSVQGVVGTANTVAANSISWFVDNTHNETVLYVNTTPTANHVDMEIHLTGPNISLGGTDILHH